MLKEDLLLLFNNATQAPRLMCRGISVQKPSDSRQEADRVSYYRSFVIISSNVLTRYPCHRVESIPKLMRESSQI